MACSDNVVRAGLTPKFRDVDTLVKMLDYTPVTVADLKMRPKTTAACEMLYSPEDSSVNEFEVLSIDIPPDTVYTLRPYSSPSIVLVHEGYGHVVEDDLEDLLMPGSVYLLPAGQSVGVRSTPKSSLRIFSARCREAFYGNDEGDDDNEAEEVASKVEESSKIAGDAKRPSIVNASKGTMIPGILSREQLDRPASLGVVSTPLWSVASARSDAKSNFRQFFVVAGGGGSAKTGIKNSVVLGYVGSEADTTKFVKTCTLEMDDLPNSIAVAQTGLTCAFTNKTDCVVYTIENGRTFKYVGSFPATEDGSSADKNPVAFSETGVLLATGSELGELSLSSLRSGVLRQECVLRVKDDDSSGVKPIAILDLDFWRDECLAVACDDGACRIYGISDGKLKLVDTVRAGFVVKEKTKCSSCTFVGTGKERRDSHLVVTLNGPINYSGVGRNRKVTQHPCYVCLVRFGSEWSVSVSRPIPLNMPVNCSTISRDGHHVALGHKNGSVSIWKLDVSNKTESLRCARVCPRIHLFAVNGIQFLGQRKGPRGIAPPVLTVSGDGLCYVQPIFEPPAGINLAYVVALFVLLVAILVPALCHYTPDRNTFEKLREYYSSKDDLEKYTLNQEIDRMDYVVFTSTGKILRKSEDIRQFGKTCRDHRYYRMWRYANQSLLADVLLEIQTIIVRPHDPEGELSVRVANLNTKFSLNFATGKTIVESDFTIGTVQNTVFGTIMGRVEIDFSKSVLEQRVRPIRLKVLFDEKLDACAQALAMDSIKSGHASKRHTRSSAQKSGDGLFERLKAPPDFVELIGQGIKQLDKYVQETVDEESWGAWGDEGDVEEDAEGAKAARTQAGVGVAKGDEKRRKSGGV
eukprot:g3805.t1